MIVRSVPTTSLGQTERENWQFLRLSRLTSSPKQPLVFVLTHSMNRSAIVQNTRRLPFVAWTRPTASMATQLRIVTGSARAKKCNNWEIENLLLPSRGQSVLLHTGRLKRERTSTVKQKRRLVLMMIDRRTNVCASCSSSYIVDEDDDDEKFKSVLIQLFFCLFASLYQFDWLLENSIHIFCLSGLKLLFVSNLINMQWTTVFDYESIDSLFICCLSFFLYISFFFL